MNPLIRFVLTVFACVAMVECVQAQIPNGDFESWLNTETPESWSVNNTPFYTTSSQTTDRHAGSYALRGEVVSYSGAAVPAYFISMPFPVSQRYRSLSGYFKFAPVNGDMIAIVIVMLKQGGSIGGGGAVNGSAYSNFTQWTIPIEYADSTTVPDSAYIQIVTAVDTITSELHVGTVLMIDDLSLGLTTAVKDPSGMPGDYRLAQNFPNPFNPSTTLRYELPADSKVHIAIYNILGEMVTTLADGVERAGNKDVEWNAADVGTGIYFCRMHATSLSDPSRSFTAVRKLMLVK